MLDIQIAVQIVISICVGLSYLAVNHYSVLSFVKYFINLYSVIAIVIYLFIAFNLFDFTKNLINFANFLFESFLVLFPWIYFTLKIGRAHV